MPYPTYTVDGVALDAPGWRLAPGTQLRPLPAARSVEVSLPGRAGDLPVTGLDLEASVLGLTLLVNSRDGQGRQGGYPQLERNLEALTGLFGVRHRMLDLRYHVDRRTVRQADAEVVASAEPEVTVAAGTARLTVLARVPGVFWRDPDPVSWQGPLTVDPPAEGALVTWLAGGTAPVTDAVVRLSGSIDQPTVMDVATGAGFAWSGSLTQDQTLEVDCAAMTARRVGPGEESGTDVTGLVRQFGSGSASRWLHLTPAVARGNPHQRHVRVRASAVSAGETSQIRITARRAFL